VLGPEFAGGIAYAEARLLRGDRMRLNGTPVVGFAGEESSSSISFEGTAQMALAYRLAGNPDKAERYLAELRRAILPSPRFADAAGLPAATSRPPWEGACEDIYTPAQAWFLLAVWGVNPLATPPAR
jgi:hypothetical protein